MLRNLIKYNYSLEHLAVIRRTHNLKVCYKSHLKFLARRTTNVKHLANQIAVRSNFVYSYKTLRQVYILMLRNFFFKSTTKKVYFTNPNITYFLNIYKQYNSLRDLDRALLWRASQVNSLFDMRTQETKKKKKFFYKNRIVFIRQPKRILLVWKWLKLFTKASHVAKSPRLQAIPRSLTNFLTTAPDQNVIFNTKYHIYKVQLLRSL